MLTPDQIDSFHRDGYLLVPGLLTADQVAGLRKSLLAKFNVPPEKRYPGDTGHVVFDLFGRYEDLRWLLFHEPTLRVLKSLLGEDFVVLRETAAHRGVYTGWHKDTTSQEREGHTFQWDPDYLMIEAGYYLQDNTPEHGGGLDVEPGSHRAPDPFLKEPGKVRKALKRIGAIGGPVKNVVSVPNKAGDLILFDFRTNHRATHRAKPPPPGQEKLSIFLACSTNTPHVKKYHDFIHGRPSYVYLKDFSYAPDLLEEATRNGLRLV
jgi:hypothetical protein